MRIQGILLVRLGSKLILSQTEGDQKISLVSTSNGK